jgi:hypothetical protein
MTQKGPGGKPQKDEAELQKRRYIAGQLSELVTKAAWSIEDFRKWLFAETGREKITHMTVAELESVKQTLQAHIAAAEQQVEEIGVEADEILDKITATGAVVPVLTEEQATSHFQRFQALKKAVLTDADYLFIGTDGRPCAKGKHVAEYIKKSGWRKIALMFGISIVYTGAREVTGTDSDGEWHGAAILVRAIAPNGRFVEAEGVCTTRNDFFCKRYDQDTKKPYWIDTDEKNLICTAQTVAINRAISDLVGSGELSAEEVECNG